MNRESRREQKKNAIAAVKKSKAWIVVVWDGNNLPIYSFDITPCKDEKYLSQFVMRILAENTVKTLKTAWEVLRKEIAETEAKGKTEEIKEKRSKELSHFGLIKDIKQPKIAGLVTDILSEHNI
jgi:hypothetical protein